MSGCFMTFKDKGGDKNENNKLMFLCIDDDKLLEKHKTIWTKIGDLINIEINALPVYNDRYIKTKIRAYCDKIYTNFRGLKVSEDGAEGGSFIVISLKSLLVYDKELIVVKVMAVKNV